MVKLLLYIFSSIQAKSLNSVAYPLGKVNQKKSPLLVDISGSVNLVHAR